MTARAPSAPARAGSAQENPTNDPAPTSTATTPRRGPPRLVAIGGGKGGVGKSFLCSTLAIILARAGHRVVAIDTDIEGPNLHTWLGVRTPDRSLADFVAGRTDDPAELLLGTGIAGLDMIAATHGNLAGAQPEVSQRARLLERLRQLDADFVFVDCGAGAHPATIDYFLVGDDGLLVLHPEPTSVENTYTFVRAAFYRRMQIAMRKHEVRERVREAMDQRNQRGIKTPQDLLSEIESMDPEEGQRFVASMRAFRPRIVVNEVASAEDIKLGFSVKSVCKRFFGIEADYIGYINRDQAVRDAVLYRKPLIDVHPNSDPSIYAQRIARKLAEARAENR